MSEPSPGSTSAATDAQPRLSGSLEGRRVLLAVSGGIAAYKAALLTRLLSKAGADVQVMMTRAAQHFVGAATFAALTNKIVATDLFDPQQEAAIGHIALADDADLLVVAPATAHTIARMAHGLADDLVSAVYLAYRGPVLLAPAMNVHMWAHPATRDNVARLVGRGHALVGPGEGEMACGHVGAGRMSEPEEILAAAEALMAPMAPSDATALAGRRVIVTAGPTREAIDPVRFIGNHSSGKMGFAIAAAAAAAGAEVVLVSGPTSLPTPGGVERVDVDSAASMAEATLSRAGADDVVVCAAAVADYTPREAAAEKIKKSDDGAGLTLELVRTTDILAELGARDRATRPQVLVGFAAETGGDLAAKGREKLARKGCDLLVANDLNEPGSGFGVDTNRVLFIGADGAPDRQPLMTKQQVAHGLIARIATLLGEASANEDSA